MAQDVDDALLGMMVRTALALTDDRNRVVAAVMKGSGGTADPIRIGNEFDRRIATDAWLSDSRIRPETVRRT